jgi:hypothetical protein
MDILINSEPYQLSPLTLGQLKRLGLDGHLEHINGLDGQLKASGYPTPVQIDAIVAVLSAALIRLQPRCSPQWVEDNVTPVEFITILATVMGSTIPEGMRVPKAESPKA